MLKKAHILMLVTTTISFLQGQEIEVFKIRQEDCDTKCENGLLNGIDILSLNTRVILPTDLLNNSAVIFEIRPTSSTLFNSLFSVDIKSDCTESKNPGSSYHCSKISENMFNISMTINAVTALSEATVRGEIKHYNLTTIAHSEQTLPIICESKDVAGFLQINGENVTDLNNCTVSMKEDDLNLEFECIGLAKPCVIEVTSSVWNERNVGENKVVIKRSLNQDAEIKIRHALCRLDKDVFNMTCKVIAVSKKHHTELIIIVLITGILTVIVFLFSLYSLQKIISNHMKKVQDLEQNPDEVVTLKSKEKETTNYRPNVNFVVRDSGTNNNDKAGALIDACLHGQLEDVKMLIQSDTDINKKDKDGLTPLMHALEAKNTKLIELLIEHGADCEEKTSQGMTYLMLAAVKGLTDIAEMLIDNNANVNATNKIGSTALMIASLHGHADIVAMLMQKGADAGYRNKDGMDALMCASKNGHTYIVKLIIEDWSNKTLTKSLINERTVIGQNALMFASLNGHTETVELLLQHNADVRLKDYKGFTCLMFASLEGHTEIIQKLIKHKAELNQRDNDGFTPLMLASQNGHKGTIKVLMKKGAEVNAQNASARTALMLASSKGQTEVVHYLCKHGAKVNRKDSKQMTALMFALKNNNVDISSMLLKKGAKVKKGDKNGLTCLMLASIHGLTETVETTIKKGAHVDDKTHLGLNALMYACEKGHSETAELLVKNGTNLNEKDITGANALMLASKQGHADICRLLIQNKAAVCERDHQNKTALMYARENGHAEIVDLLTPMENKENEANSYRKDLEKKKKRKK
ncbi:unnamed protein product [Lymnaea stagnalis]|uniref:Uncharacterized protein n=1 Tax=Lymnaea stagnalis TaxID=6523 RepID=A0AAV2H404_LYMST